MSVKKSVKMFYHVLNGNYCWPIKLCAGASLKIRPGPELLKFFESLYHLKEWVWGGTIHNPEDEVWDSWEETGKTRIFN